MNRSGAVPFANIKYMEKITQITPAWDKRDPDPKKNYGIHCCDLRMVLKGELGAVQFVLMTGWNLPHIQEEQKAKGNPTSGLYPLPADLGYHSPKPMYEGQTRIGENRYDFEDTEELQMGNGVLKMPKSHKVEEKDLPICEYIGCPCYYDGSGLNAERIYKIMLTEGSDGVWRELESYYITIFGELK
jgi:hypothetical protein